MDFRRAETLVFAIIPFHKIAIHFRLGAEAGKFTGPGRAPQRTCEYARELTSSQLLSKLTCVAFALVGEREIGGPGMLTRESPCGLTVSCEVNDWQRFTHGIASSKSVVSKVTANIGDGLTRSSCAQLASRTTVAGEPQAEHGFDGIHHQAKAISLIS
jgi:hypothetical protein